MQRKVLWGLFLATLVPACGGPTPLGTGGAGGTGGSGTTTVTSTYPFPTELSFCQEQAKDECNATVVKACYGSDDTTLAEDQKSCVAARQDSCNLEHLPYHPEAAQECLAALTSALADAVWTHDEIASTQKACLGVFSNKLSEGAVCTAPYDCDVTAGLSCVVKLGAIQGSCAAPKIVNGGQDCSDPAAVCDDLNYCDPKVEHCLAKPSIGQGCSASAPCLGDAYCTSPDNGMCMQKTKNGLACQKDDLCSGGFCVGATTDKDGVCSSTSPLQINGDSCSLFRK